MGRQSSHMEDLKSCDPAVPRKRSVHRLPFLPVAFHPLFPSCSVPRRDHTLFGSIRTQTLLLLSLFLGSRRFSLVCIQSCLRIKKIPEREYLVACRLLVDLHAQTLLDPSTRRIHFVFPLLTGTLREKPQVITTPPNFALLSKSLKYQ